MAQRFASRLALFLIAIFAALPVCLLASASSARAAGHAAKTRIARAVKSPVAKHRISHSNALPFTSVKALAARIEDMKAAAEKKKLDDEAAGTDFLESILYFIRQRAFPKDSIDLSAYARGVAQRDRLAPARIGQGQIIANTFIPSNQWHFVGPANLGIPYNTYYGNGPLSGRVNALAYDPATPKTYYLVAGGGGVWKTTDGGMTWTPLSNTWKYQQASCIALDPSNHDTLYVGTGDIAYASYASGIMKSTDGGTTWTDLGLTSFGTDGVNAIIVDPETPSIITAAAGNTNFGYVYRSTDSGATWTRAFAQRGIWTDLKYGIPNASGIRHYYVASAYAGPNADEELWRSDDRGVTWTQLTIPATGYDYTEGLVVAPSATAPDTVYLESGNDQILWKSTDAGATWTDITSGLTAAEPGLSDDAAYNWSQGGYDIALNCVAGGSADTVYDSLIDLARSTDSGTTWASLGGPTYNQNGNAVLHNDQHALAVNPADPTDFLVGCDGGAYHYVFPSGAATPTITSLNQNIGITQFYKAAYHPTNPNIIIAGAQDNASPLCQGMLSTWGNSPSGGDGGGCAINQTNPNDQYSTSQDLTIYHTTDGWNNQISFISPNFPSSETEPFVGILTLDPTSPNLLYTGTQYLYQYNSTTGTWTEFTNQALTTTTAAPNAGTLQAIAVAPTSGQVIYTGSSEGNVWMTANQGSSWTEIDGVGVGTSPLPGRAVTSIEISPTNPNDILVGLSGTGGGHLYRCADTTKGTSCVWTNLSGSGTSALPDVPLNAITRDPDFPTSTFYVGMDIGVFATTDGGTTWTNATLPLGLPNVQVNDLKAVPGTHYLNAATYGRGIWRISLTVPAPPMITGFTPAAGLAGTSVTITGSGFTGTTSVKFNGTTATFTLVSDTVITTTVPTGATTGPISVTAPPGTGTSTASFYVTNLPIISGFTPTQGIPGTMVTITGANFTGVTAVAFGRKAASVFTLNGDTSITATVANGTNTGPISVTTPHGTGTSATNFVIVVPPVISSFTPTGGVAGTSVVITGANFTTTTTVSFNGATATFLVSGDTRITATVPSGATTGRITVTNIAGSETSTGVFTVYTLPTISSFSPVSGPVGGTVVISGSGFTGAASVTFNGTSATFSVVSDSSIKATVPNGATTGQISVTTPGGTGTSASIFTIVTPPTITSFTPTSAAPGDVVTITGTYFTGAINVTFNGTATAYSVLSATSIMATAPSGAVKGPITVTTPGGTATSAASFTLIAPAVPPTITSISPTSGTAGTVVTITGTNLSSATSVTVNGVAVPFTVVSSTKITFTVPAGTKSGVISVTTPGGTVTSGGISFTFLIWNVRDVAAASDGTARLLWNRSDNGAVVWTLNASDAMTGNTAVFGPYSDSHGNWTAKSVRVAHDGTMRLLWVRSDGAAGVWTLNAAGAQTVVGPTYGPYTDTHGTWSAAGLGVAQDGTVRLLWTRSDGGAGVWTLNAGDTETTIGPTYGPYTDTQGTWSAAGIGVAGDGTSRLLWKRSDHAMGVWSFGTNDVETVIGPTNGPVSDSHGTWTVGGLGTSSDGTSRILWTRSDGAAGLWSMSASDAVTTTGTVYGPYTGYAATALDTSLDQSRVLWVRSDRAAGIWTFSSADVETLIGSVYGPL